MTCGQCGDILYSPDDLQSDIDGQLVRTTDRLERIRKGINNMRWHSGLEQYPYQDGIEGLRTSLICVLNILDDLTAYIRDGGLDYGSDD